MNEAGQELSERRVDYRGTGFYVGLAGLILSTALLLILAVQNTGDVDLEFLGWDVTMPLFAVAIGFGLIVLVLDEAIGLVWRHHRRRVLAERAELRRLRAQVQAYEAGDTGGVQELRYEADGHDETKSQRHEAGVG